ncbi:endonuclease/exonuclease/phosphatase family protein [Jiangella mangrovi]|uniref:Endonuclease/exonuclease/phosphatase family metal-dependent hydrolase n=1 Tax=Jiangella mangrovi TaxID=1524084 RepID=A0A7W9LL43_9ACTN|nr:endonuclease/exonuclease/phosphatase family protein [Jiangella mangrovi]MBB5787810.1 endonuclease/exonuclease/phosphatase family metal-dependent hydrolase [Jiangella mangrovi]
MTWNVWWRFGERWRERQIGIAATLAAHQPDIVGLQESWSVREASQAAVLAAPLGLHSVYGGPSLPDPIEAPGHDGVDLGLAILSRWPIRHAWTHRLPTSRAERPVALVAAVEHPDGVLHVVCACAEHHAHLADDHLAQTRELARLVTDLSARDGDLPVLLVGDLNAGPDTPEIATLTSGDALTDAWTAGGADGDGVTLSAAHPDAPLGAVKQLNRRIDYVMFRPSIGGSVPKVTRTAVVDEPVNGLYPSDHFAVIVDLAV